MKQYRMIETIEWSNNEHAFAIGRRRDPKKRIFHIRRVVWGRLLAREEKREGEQIRRVQILITGK